MIEQQIEQDIKSAMLARDSLKVDTLRGLKSVFLYSKVASGTRDQPLSDQDTMALLGKEAKKRQESADLYAKGGEQARADKELSEKAIIESYLPAKLSESDLVSIVDEVIGAAGPDSNMGQLIGLIKSKTSGSADGSDIARLVKERLN
jgi:uncharacterized protein YqeY